MDPILSVSLPANVASPGGSHVSAAQGPRASIADSDAFAALMAVGDRGPDLGRAVTGQINEMSNRYAELNSEWRNFSVDLKDPAAMVHVIDHQAKVTAANLHLQLALHTAETARSSVQKLFQQQS
jgi:hypothetical protein